MNNENDLKPYLASTPLCDYNHQDIKKIISRIIKSNMDDVEKAKAIFYYIRDNVKYAIMGAGFITPASKVLNKGYGDCGTKTNAHIALLRAAKIPARMHGVLADTSVLEGIMPQWMYKMATKNSCKDFHFWAECYIEDRWIGCDGLIDQKLYENGIKEGIFSKEKIPNNDWNGEDDFSPLKPWILEDFGFKAGWDEWSRIYLKFLLPGLPKIVVNFSSLFLSPICRNYTDRIRKKVFI